MKKAFTMLELVFVIVVIGILAAAIIPNTKTNPVQEAAVQVLSHIRYTQHLAMIDDKYDANDGDWYKNRWQIFFANTSGSDNQWAYSIFSDYLGTSTGTPDVNELAVNPSDTSKLLTGGYSAGTVAYADTSATKALNVGHKYGITNVAFSSSCSSGSLRIAFDNMGRPMYENSRYLDSPYKYGANNRLLQNICYITLSGSNESAQIAIWPETGFACVLAADGNCT